MSNKNFQYYLSNFLTKEMAANRNNSTNTITSYAFTFKLYLEYMNKEQGVKRKFSALRMLYNYLYCHDMVTQNPTSKVATPKLRQKEITRLDPNEVADMLDQAESGAKLTKKQKESHEKTKLRDIALLTLLLGTGIRVSECVGLNVNDVDFDNGCIKVVRKGGKEAIVYFGDEVENALLEYIEHRLEIFKPIDEDADALFISSKHAFSSSDAFEKSINIYDLYSLMANCSAIVDLPTRLAPSSSTAYLSAYFSFHSNN